MSPSRRVAAAALALSLIVLPVAPVAAEDQAAPATGPTPVAEALEGDLATTGAALVDRFLAILSEGNESKQADLEGFLAPEFQLLRGDGTRLDRDEYIANPATTMEYRVLDLQVTGSEGVIVATYLLDTTVTIDDVTRTATAPRLSVFHQAGDGEWQLAGHANFIPLEEAAPSPSPS
jgi:hypothetical protein